MKYTEFSLNGQTLFLLYNGEAMFSLMDTVGENQVEEISKEGRDGFSALCSTLHILAVQGELARRYEGYEKGEIVTREKIAALLSPNDIYAAKSAVMNAMIKGFNCEYKDEDEVIDEVLQEIEKKKEP